MPSKSLTLSFFMKWEMLGFLTREMCLYVEHMYTIASDGYAPHHLLLALLRGK